MAAAADIASPLEKIPAGPGRGGFGEQTVAVLADVLVDQVVADDRGHGLLDLGPELLRVRIEEYFLVRQRLVRQALLRQRIECIVSVRKAGQGAGGDVEQHTLGAGDVHAARRLRHGRIGRIRLAQDLYAISLHLRSGLLQLGHHPCQRLLQGEDLGSGHDLAHQRQDLPGLLFISHQVRKGGQRGGLQPPFVVLQPEAEAVHLRREHLLTGHGECGQRTAHHPQGLLRVVDHAQQQRRHLVVEAGR